MLMFIILFYSFIFIMLFLNLIFIFNEVIAQVVIIVIKLNKIVKILTLINSFLLIIILYLIVIHLSVIDVILTNYEYYCIHLMISIDEVYYILICQSPLIS